MNSYKGRRFLGFVLSMVALCAGFFVGDPEIFGAFSMALSGMYGLYLGGQSATDWQKAKNGGG